MSRLSTLLLLLLFSSHNHAHEIHSSWNSLLNEATPLQAGKLQLSGKGVEVVYFWATWCGPCIHSTKVLQEAKTSHNLQVLALSAEDPKKVRNVLSQRYGGKEYIFSYGVYEAENEAFKKVTPYFPVVYLFRNGELLWSGNPSYPVEDFVKVLNAVITGLPIQDLKHLQKLESDLSRLSRERDELLEKRLYEKVNSIHSEIEFVSQQILDQAPTNYVATQALLKIQGINFQSNKQKYRQILNDFLVDLGFKFESACDELTYLARDTLSFITSEDILLVQAGQALAVAPLKKECSSQYPDYQYFIASSYATLLGNKQEAKTLLEKAIEIGKTQAHSYQLLPIYEAELKKLQ